MHEAEADQCLGDHEDHDHPKLEDRLLDKASTIFAAAGEPGRLRILHSLLFGEHCVSELAEESGDSMSTVSQRLKVLRASDLVGRRREGKHIFYFLADEHVAALVRSALEHASHHHER